MVGDVEQAVLKVDELAGDVKGDDLPGAVADQFLAIGKPGNEQRADGRRFPFAQRYRNRAQTAARSMACQ